MVLLRTSTVLESFFLTAAFFLAGVFFLAGRAFLAFAVPLAAAVLADIAIVLDLDGPFFVLVLIVLSATFFGAVFTFATIFLPVFLTAAAANFVAIPDVSPAASSFFVLALAS